MPALIPELVNMASNPNVSTADLLRRALVAARRLDIPEFVNWIDSEMNGYAPDTPIPDYRKFFGELVVYNHVRGHDIPCATSNSKMEAFLRYHEERQSIAVIEQLLAAGKPIIKYFPHEIERQLEESMQFPLRPKLVFSNPQIRGIVEMARNKILDWALELEGQGIIGEGMSFTTEEKNAVQQHFHISNVSGSQIQISSNGSTQTQSNPEGTDISGLKGLIEALGSAFERVQGDSAAELRAELATLKAQANSPKPKWEVIKATAKSIKSIAEGAGSNILAGLAQPHITTLLALAS